MNQYEIEALQQPGIDNLARLIYCLGLRPNADSVTGYTNPISYKTLANLLNSGGANIEFGRDINVLLLQLKNSKLISCNPNLDTGASLNGERVHLPLMLQQDQTSQQDLHFQTGPMQPNWRPEQTTFAQVCSLVGILKKEYDSEELGEFIAYWLGRPQVKQSQYQWIQKFVLSLKNKRSVSGKQDYQVVGYQKAEKQAEVQLDDKSKQLIEKYHGKPTQKD